MKQAPLSLPPQLLKALARTGVETVPASRPLHFTAKKEKKELQFRLVVQSVPVDNCFSLPFDVCFTQPEKVAALILNRLGLNQRVFARQCQVRPITKTRAAQFLDEHHLMSSTACAAALGLFFRDELLAIATFSKGRKMRYLEEELRSFELIRFCCKAGYSIPGGLSKLVTEFCRIKNAGDVMTYVDRQLSDGSAFLKAGFKRTGETPPRSFLVDRRTLERKEFVSPFDHEKYYQFTDQGNLKLTFTPAFERL